MRPRLALLNAAYEDEGARRNFRRELDADLVEFDATAGHLPEGYDYDGLAITGSGASVYWEEPWIEATREYVAGAVERELPVLGVCWGHQLLADALGGRVEAMDGYEIGYRTVEHDGDRLFRSVPEEFTVYTTHGDAVVELPPGAAVIAENDRCCQGFRLGAAYGVQFHPEYDTDTAREVTAGKDDLPTEQVERALATITDENYRAAQRAKCLFDEFLAVVEEAGREART
jgi:GMP synthase (glutamine-hydrolysing)